MNLTSHHGIDSECVKDWHVFSSVCISLFVWLVSGLLLIAWLWNELCWRTSTCWEGWWFGAWCGTLTLQPLSHAHSCHVTTTRLSLKDAGCCHCFCFNLMEISVGLWIIGTTMLCHPFPLFHMIRLVFKCSQKESNEPESVRWTELQRAAPCS